MPDTGEALKIWQALRPMVDKEIAEQTENCVRAKKMIVKQATVQNEDGSVSLGVAEPYNDKQMIPSGEELANVNPGSPVWVYWYFNNASTMHVALKGDGTQGSAVTDRLLEMLNKEIADREKADQGLYEHFTTENNNLQSYIETTASNLRLEFTDDLNGLRSYLELTASHLRAEFYDDVNSLRSYLELTASHLRAEFYDDVNSLRSYLELTASHLRTEFYDDVNSLRSYVEITASHLRAEYYDDINSLRSYVIIQAGRIDMNVAATDENSSILRQAGMYINDQGVLVYAADNANNLQSKLNVQADRIGLVVSGTGANASIKAAEIVAAINNQGSTVKISADHIVLDGDAVATSLYSKTLDVGDFTCTTFTASGAANFYGNATVDGWLVAEGGVNTSDVRIGENVSVSGAIANFGTATASGGSISIPTTTLGGSAGPSINFNIADTQFYIDGVAAARRAGVNSVTISNSDIVRDGSDYYNPSTHTTTIYVEATASNGAYGTQSFTTGTEAYDAGENSVYVQSWNSPTWNASGVTVSGTLSNGRTFSQFFSE